MAPRRHCSHCQRYRREQSQELMDAAELKLDEGAMELLNEASAE